jgi:hypothetical protein
MRTLILITGLLAACIAFTSRAEELLPVAVFDFESKDDNLRDLGPKISALLNAHLSTDARLITVERAEIEKLLGEQELGLSGTIQADTAAKVGHLTGAKVIITGRTFMADRQLMIVAKIIGTETGRVYGELASGPGLSAMPEMCKDLASRIAKTVADKSDTLTVAVPTREDRVARLKKLLPKDKELPVVSISVPERHINAPTIDPAVETELGLILRALGFTITSLKEGSSPPKIEITGEAFSELGLRRGNLVSCKGRVELKATDKATGNVIFIDRQTAVAVDLSEHIAGKSALQDAAATLLERMLPSLLK